jgi:hypothetical protein
MLCPCCIHVLLLARAYLWRVPGPSPAGCAPLVLDAERRLEAGHQRRQAVGVVAQQCHLAAAAAAGEQRQQAT